MRCVTLLALPLCLLLPSLAGAEAWDFTIDDRSPLHFFCSAPFGAAANTLLYQNATQMDTDERLLWAVALGMAPGVAKEAWDGRRGGTGWDNEDLLADAVGVVLGVALTEVACRLAGPSAYERNLAFVIHPGGAYLVGRF